MPPRSATKQKESSQVAAFRERLRVGSYEAAAAERCCERQEPFVKALQRQLADAHTAVVGFEIDCVNARNACAQNTEEMSELRAACLAWPQRLGSAIAEEQRLKQVSADLDQRANTLEADCAELEELLAAEDAGRAELDELRQQICEAEAAQAELRSEDTVKTSIVDCKMAITELERQLAERNHKESVNDQAVVSAEDDAQLLHLQAQQYSLKVYCTSLLDYQRKLEDELASAQCEYRNADVSRDDIAVATLSSSLQQSEALELETEQLQALGDQLKSLKAALNVAGQMSPEADAAVVAEKFGLALNPLLLRLGASTPQERARAALEVGTVLREVQIAMQEGQFEPEK